MSRDSTFRRRFVRPARMSWRVYMSILLMAGATSAFAAGNAAEVSDAITSHIPRVRVDSSGLTSVGYSKRKHILELEFANGAVYRYLNVPPSVYRDLLAAESKARYYDQNIKRNYQSVRVRPRVKDQPKN
jgi:hypothetical protein